MLGVDAYGSDSDSDSSTPPAPKSKPSGSSLVASLPPPKKASTFSLPPPTNLSSSVTSKGPSLPAPKAKKRDGPVRITVEAPKPLEGGDEEGAQRAAKKPRLEPGKGAGSSALLAMLPAPTKATPAAPPPQRTLGSAAASGGVGIILGGPTSSTPQREENVVPSSTEKATLFKPLGLVKGKEKASTTKNNPAPAVDFFSLGSSSAPRISTESNPSTSAPSLTVSSAPEVKEFVPPVPTPIDPYPGYYQLPSGEWAAYDPEYYRSVWQSWQPAELEKGFEGADGDDVKQINAKDEVDRKRKEIEDTKAITAGGPAATEPAQPNMTITPAKMSGRARSRHQLTTLLSDAYQNRAALEEKIAQAKRNRKEAGSKYGF